MSMTVSESAAVVAQLRQARRKQRVAQIHWVDAFYQVYLTGIVAIVAVVFLSGLTGDGELSATALRQVRADGAALVGIVASLALAMGLRSGSRGGPLALEAADVRHVLLSPVDRGVALRGPALRQARFLALCGVGVGAVAGQLALRRLPGNDVAWVACGAGFGLLCVALGFGGALVASGRRLKPWLASLVGFVLVAWSIVDATGRGPAAPGTFAGRLALWPLHVDLLALVPVGLAVALVAVGIAGVAGTSLEAAERRTSLVGQLKFAVTLQDLRTVLVLRRQLASEVPRTRPWIRGSKRPTRFAVWRRGWRGVLRWPAARVIRCVVLAIGAGLALRGVWAGTTPLLLLAGLAMWVAALDAVEPMAQEIDHPGLKDSYPMEQGILLVRHLATPAAVMALLAAIATGTAALPGGGSVPLAAAAVALLPLALLATAGAVVSVVQGAPNQVDSLAIMTPEIASSRTVFRTVWPPGLAVLGTLPILAARAAERSTTTDFTAASAAAAAALPLLLVAVLAAGWMRFREPIHDWFRRAAEEMSPARAAGRDAGLRPVPVDREDDDE